jgi:hypothetical protein
MSLNKGKDCRKCVYFKSHDTYEYFGLCIEKNELQVKTPSMEACHEYKEVGIDDLKNVLFRRGWIHCLSCNKAIYTVEELVEHLEDELGLDLYSDVVASEEAPTAS